MNLIANSTCPKLDSFFPSSLHIVLRLSMVFGNV
jgi:hypothetical protein